MKGWEVITLKKNPTLNLPNLDLWKNNEEFLPELTFQEMQGVWLVQRTRSTTC